MSCNRCRNRIRNRNRNICLSRSIYVRSRNRNKIRNISRGWQVHEQE